MRLPHLPAHCAAFVVVTLALMIHSERLLGEERASATAEPLPLAAALGVRFVDGSDSSIILERDGKQYVVDLSTRTIREQEPIAVALADPQQTPVRPAPSSGNGAMIFQQQCASCHGNDGKGTGGTMPDLTNFRDRGSVPLQRIIDAVTNGRANGAMPSFSGRLSTTDIESVSMYVQGLSTSGQRTDIYEAADDYVYSLPTGRRLAKGALVVNFAHRFAFNPAFSGKGLGNTLLGLDGFSVSSFGFRYGITDKLSASVYRSPSIINRPIEFTIGYNFLDEYEDHPFNAAFRISIDGQDNFRKNFTTNAEVIISRSFSNKAQFYAVPTFSIENRRLMSKPGPLENRPANLPGINTFSIGAGLAVNIRPTVALVAEGIPTLVNGRELGIHRPAYAFGIQKWVRGHAFTLAFGNGPGTVVNQRAGTRASFVGNPSADKPSGMFIGFNLSRRLR